MDFANRYATLREGKIREHPPSAALRDFSELEIQARWFAGEFGRNFKTPEGEAVEIVQFGVWNREAGPDFTEAAIRLHGEIFRGAIEFDPDARDWERHGHATDAHYDTVVLHVFAANGGARFFTRTKSNRNVPQVLLDLRALDEPPNPQPLAKPGRCGAPLRDLPEEKLREVLRGAAQFRMRKKSARLARLVGIHGFDEALFQALATALGYKSNKLPFTLLAQRVPLKMLAQNRDGIDALLFGVAGFLDADFERYANDARGWLRELWDHWWKRRAEFERLVIARGEWRLGGQRPMNHPQRRVAALAQIARHFSKIRALAKACDVAAIEKFFAELHDEFWQHHFTLTSKRTSKPIALAGETRVTEMLANVFFPLAVLETPARWSEYEKLPAPLSNRHVETAALRLLADHPLRASLLKTVVGQQALLQIYEDFCMQDASDCEACLFPKQLAQW